MTRLVRLPVLIVVLLTALGTTMWAQEKPASAVPVRVQIVIIRQQGSKEISRLPYTLALNANDGANRAALRMGAEVPIKSTAFNPSTQEGKPAAALSSFTYRSIGTLIDCGPITSADGRFKVHLSIEDSSLYPDPPGAGDASRLPDAPAFRSFRTSTVLTLRDGETTQFTAATDRINGEVVRVEVTLNVTK